MAKTKLGIDNKVRKFRFEQGEMTQQALADAVGVARQTIVAIEKNRYSPSLDLAFQLALAFGKPIEEVFFVDRPEQPTQHKPRVRLKAQG
ncbi:MAG: helix-turn-helix transcriptional regulator [Gammaproteobacteria bacterium]|nr:helix-turn-helix transcriptional regulator [Gammaproteobacteria bacterium]